MHITELFVKTLAIRNTVSTVEAPHVYGLEITYGEMFDLLTGDTAFDQLPQALQDDLGSLEDLNNYAADLNEKYSVIMDTLRTLKGSELCNQILAGVE